MKFREESNNDDNDDNNNNNKKQQYQRNMEGGKGQRQSWIWDKSRLLLIINGTYMVFTNSYFVL